jgi:hypothetical protein
MPLDTPASEVTAAIRTGLTIELIATPRAMMKVRQRSDRQDLKNDPELEDFDFVPIKEGDEIVGVFDREQNRIRDLSEVMLRASDDSLLSFVEYADTRKFALLASDCRVVGIVTLADIQKLPVYCVLFSLLISVEMLLMELIRKACKDDPDKWIKHIKNEKAKKAIEDHWKKSKRDNIGIDMLACASFSDELTAAGGLKLLSTGETEILNRLKKLRNDVFHGKEIGLAPDCALKIPSHVRDALRIQDALNKKLNGHVE